MPSDRCNNGPRAAGGVGWTSRPSRRAEPATLGAQQTGQGSRLREVCQTLAAVASRGKLDSGSGGCARRRAVREPPTAPDPGRVGPLRRSLDRLRPRPPSVLPTQRTPLSSAGDRGALLPVGGRVVAPPISHPDRGRGGALSPPNGGATSGGGPPSGRGHRPPRRPP